MILTTITVRGGLVETLELIAKDKQDSMILTKFLGVLREDPSVNIEVVRMSHLDVKGE